MRIEPSESGPLLVTKGTFLSAFLCLTKGWYQRTNKPPPSGPGELFRMQEGQEVHRRARTLFKGGVFAGSVEQTEVLLSQDGCDTIFEAAFVADGFTARADIIDRSKTGSWDVIEIKSGVHSPGKYKPDYVDDLAYTVMVLRIAGLTTSNNQLMVLSPDWRLGMGDEDLFTFEFHPLLVMERVREFEARSEEIRDAVLSEMAPDPALNYECRRCRFFDTPCIGRSVQNPIFELPRLSKAKIESCAELDVIDLKQLPEEIQLSATQVQIRSTIITGQPMLDDVELQELLAQVRWPAGYLDFETFKAAIPIWPDVAPHEQIATQYSLHICDEPGVVRDHKSYLADPAVDCRRELAEQLISDTKGLESVVSYSPFERTTIRRLADRFPDLAKSLITIADRLFDLEKVFKTAYIHPGFRGRTSIKRTLPVLVPGMGYEGLAIPDGDAAIAAFGRLTQPECTEDETLSIRESLLEYCEQDTLAMVRLHAAVAQLIE